MQNNLRVIRAKQKLSQETLAKMVGISRQTLNRIENDHTEPKLQTIRALSKALNLPISDIFLIKL